ncbi:hypothetical protein PHYBOEH_011692 [Phytophthora boehmeriae]|uniref:Uncharacterized protein n=1 Tax=Phytophthora boehmeriae TaxID=109152 RepID=A0A8T1WXG7_9STRA|nr:hypothetical protein PHYBOEH_011692 [Phytophthora boehmeriae]
MRREGGACGGSSDASGVSSDSSVVDRLQETLQERIAETVGSVFCEMRQPDTGILGFDVYRTCCRHLVSYMETHMEASPGFAQQMEQVFTASFNDADEGTLKSLVTEDILVRYSTEATDQDREISIIPTKTTSAAGAENLTQTPCVDLSTATPPTVTRGSKRPIKRGAGLQNSKRQRPSVVRVLYDAERSGGQDGVENSLGSETETETEESVMGLREEENDSCPWPCTTDKPLRRSALFKRRLRNALQLVDAENCKPPAGMVCGQGCADLQSQMCQEHKGSCGEATPCHDPTCRMWTDVDTHTVRCHNSQCEFKNRVWLRKTLHIIQQKKIMVEATTAKLNRTESRLRETLMEPNSSGSFAAAEIENVIEKLEHEVAKLGDSVVFQTEREQAFRDDLNAIGICVRNDEADGLPRFESHYIKRRVT